MGARVRVDGNPIALIDYSISESATPISGGDTSGGIGTMSVTASEPDLNIPGPTTMARRFGAHLLMGGGIEVRDSIRGTVSGVIEGVSWGAGAITLDCTTDARNLNATDVRVGPHIGTLESAFNRYVSLAGDGISTSVHPSVSSRNVAYQGFEGELWLQLKNMAMAEGCEIVSAGGTLTLQPIRTNELPDLGTGMLISRTPAVSSTLAQYVEVAQYNNHAITDELVYPPHGWTPDTPVITVGAGQELREELELSASVSSIKQPTMVEFVSRDHRTSSVFTVVGDDGLPITPGAWREFGGKLSLEIGPDSKTLILNVTAPVGLPNINGSEISTYGIGLASDSGTGRYSTLRIIGSGVAFRRRERRIPTGVTPAETGTENGATIDNQFISSKSQAYAIGLRAAKLLCGSTISLRASAPLASAQFGGVAGGRYYDRGLARWMRVREAQISRDIVDMGSIDDDFIWGDLQGRVNGMTYAELDSFYQSGSATYDQMSLIGLNIE